MKDTWANDRLDTLLAELARRDATLTPGPTLEARTLAAWDEWRGGRHPPARGSRIARPFRAGRGSRIGRTAALVGAAAGMVLALILLRPAARPTLFDERRPARTMGGDPQPLERPGHLIDEQAQAPSEPARLGDPPQEVARRRPAPRAVEGPSSPSFVPLGLEVDRDLGAFQVARIPVSRGVLAGLGLLPDDQRAGEPVMADVVFGEDGMARAIRIASMSRRTP